MAPSALTDTSGNGSTPAPTDPPPPAPALEPVPEFVEMTSAELQRFPSPGTQRALKAETGRDYMALVGPDADSADRTQTQVWAFLRRRIPGLRWADCEEVGMAVVDAGALPVLDPTRPVSSTG